MKNREGGNLEENYHPKKTGANLHKYETFENLETACTTKREEERGRQKERKKSTMSVRVRVCACLFTHSKFSLYALRVRSKEKENFERTCDRNCKKINTGGSHSDMIRLSVIYRGSTPPCCRIFQTFFKFQVP